MQKLPSKLENLGQGIIAHCHFSIGFILSKENRSLKENKKILKDQIFEIVDNVRTGLIHYDFTIDFEDEFCMPMPCTQPNKDNLIPINLYEDEEELIAELYIGNSLFNPEGDVTKVRDMLYKDIKEQVKTIYEYLKDDEYEWVECE